MDALFGSVLVAVLLILVALFWRNFRRDVTLPPGPPRLPFMGSLPFMRGGNTCQIFARFRKQYGEIFTIFMGSSPVVVVNGYDNLKQLLLDKGNLTSDRPETSFLSKHIQKGKGVGPKSGMSFKIHHTFVMKTLRHLALGSNALTASLNNEMDHLQREIRSLQEEPFDPVPVLRSAAANIMLQIFISKRWEYEDEYFHSFLLECELIGIVGLAGPLALFPWLRYIPGDPLGYYRIMKAVDIVTKEFKKHIQEHKEMIDEDVPNDYTNAYLKHMKKVDSSLDFTEDDLAMEMMEMLLGGTMSTTYTIAWALAILSKYPKIQENIYNEINDVIGKKGKLPVYSDRLEDTPYTTAVLDEVQRFGDIAITGNIHKTSGDIQFAGYQLPKGISILPHLSSIHTDATLWEKREIFDPNRFLDANGNYVRRKELSPFSIGPQICPGELIARMEFYTVIVMLVQSFTIQPPTDGAVPTMDYDVGLVKVPKPFLIRCISR